MLRRLLLILGLVLFYCWWVEPARLSVTHQEVSDPDQPLQNPIRILLLTDFHLGRFSQSQTLPAKINHLLRLHRHQPFDLVLLGGDYIDDDPRCLIPLRKLLQLLAKFEIPTFAVLGNHDYVSFPEDVTPMRECLQAAGVTVLRNEAATLTVGTQQICIVGIDDLQQSRSYYGKDEYQSPQQYHAAAARLDWYAELDGLQPGIPRVMLAHNPDAAYLPGRKPLAVLAGHTHGGQMILLDWIGRPLHRWLHRLLPPGGAVTRAGRQTVNGRTLMVSRGIGGAALPLRLLRSPEAIVVTLSFLPADGSKNHPD